MASYFLSTILRTEKLLAQLNREETEESREVSAILQGHQYAELFSAMTYWLQDDTFQLDRNPITDEAVDKIKEQPTYKNIFQKQERTLIAPPNAIEIVGDDLEKRLTEIQQGRTAIIRATPKRKIKPIVQKNSLRLFGYDDTTIVARRIIRIHTTAYQQIQTIPLNHTTQETEYTEDEATYDEFEKYAIKIAETKTPLDELLATVNYKKTRIHSNAKIKTGQVAGLIAEKLTTAILKILLTEHPDEFKQPPQKYQLRKIGLLNYEARSPILGLTEIDALLLFQETPVIFETKLATTVEEQQAQKQIEVITEIYKKRPIYVTIKTYGPREIKKHANNHYEITIPYYGAIREKAQQVITITPRQPRRISDR